MSIKIKNRISILSFIFIISTSVYSQVSYDTLKIKEDFDYFNRNVHLRHNLCKISPNNDWNTFGDGMSKVLDGYIDMYKATQDKAYLYKFIFQSLCIIENRNDINPETLTQTPKWTETDRSTYTDGYIIASFAKFIHLVRVLYPELINTPLYQFDEINPEKYELNSCYCNYTNRRFQTFGEYIDWLEDRARETLDFFVFGGLWDYKRGILQPPDDELVINMQTGFARALLFLGLSTQNNQYSLMADTLAYLHKSIVKFHDKCNNIKYSKPVFILDTLKDSYWWYHNGWKIPLGSKGCVKSIFQRSPSYEKYTNFIEDVSHGTIVMMFPFEYYMYKSTDKFFSDIDMRKFRNTFVYNIYDNGNYNIGVDGSKGNTYPEIKYREEKLEIIRKTSAIGFAYYAFFDKENDTIKAEDIIFNDYIKLLHNSDSIPKWYGGQKTMGHAQLVFYQWQKHNPSLYLYSRNIVYNQDFISKNSIIIDPQYKRGGKFFPTYAEPFVFLDGGNTNRFVIEPNVKVNIVAKKSVIIKQGFHAKKGSFCRITIKQANN